MMWCDHSWMLSSFIPIILFSTILLHGELMEQNPTAFKWCSLIKRIMLFCIPLLSFVWLDARICALKKEKKRKTKRRTQPNKHILLVMQCSLRCCCRCRCCPFKYLFKRALIFCCHLLTVFFVKHMEFKTASIWTVFFLFSPRFFVLEFLLALLKNWTGCVMNRSFTPAFHQSLHQVQTEPKIFFHLVFQ